MPMEIKNRINLLDSEIYYEIYGEGIPVLMIQCGADPKGVGQIQDGRISGYYVI